MIGRITLAPTVLVVGILVGCSTGAEPTSTVTVSDPAEMFPDVTGAVFDGAGSIAVTVSSPYDSPARYADALRVRSEDGIEVYGVRELTHDHASEQPFTRSITDVKIPDDVTEVVVEGRDQVSGWGGKTVTVSTGR